MYILTKMRPKRLSLSYLPHAGLGSMSLPAVPARARSKLLRFLGINFHTLREFAPSRKTALYVSLAASPFAVYFYDRRQAKQILGDYESRVRHLADGPLPSPDDGLDAVLQYPRKIWIMSSRVPDDVEVDRANRWFKTYIQVCCCRPSELVGAALK